MAVNRVNETLDIQVPDLGVTLRTLMGVAAEGYKETQQRRWNIVYKGVRVGAVQVKDTHLKPVKAGRAPPKDKFSEAFSPQS